MKQEVDLSFLSMEAYIRIEPHHQERNDQVQLGDRALGSEFIKVKAEAHILNFEQDFKL